MGAEEEEEEERCVFIYTSASTGIAIPLSPDTTTAADLKRNLCNEHPVCFPSIGAIKVNGLMVKRRSHYYRIPDSILIKDVFQWKKGAWFLHADVILLGISDESSLPGNFGENAYNGREVTCSSKAEKHATCESNKAKEREGEECTSSEGVPEDTQSLVSLKQRDKKRSNKMSSSQKAASVDGTGEMCIRKYEEAKNISEQDEEQEHPFHYNNIETETEQEGRLSTSPSTIEASSVSVSKVASVTDLITRYFCEYDLQSSDDRSKGTTNNESRASHCNQYSLQKSTKSRTNEHQSDVIMHSPSQCARQTPFKKIHFPLPSEQRCTNFEGKLGKAEVGKRFVRVTDDIKKCGSKKEPSITVRQSNGRNLSSLFDKAAVFEFQ